MFTVYQISIERAHKDTKEKCESMGIASDYVRTCAFPTVRRKTLCTYITEELKSAMRNNGKEDKARMNDDSMNASNMTIFDKNKQIYLLFSKISQEMGACVSRKKFRINSYRSQLSYTHTSSQYTCSDGATEEKAKESNED